MPWIGGCKLSVPLAVPLRNTILHDYISVCCSRIVLFDDKYIWFTFEEAEIRKLLKCSALSVNVVCRVCRCLMQVFHWWMKKHVSSDPNCSFSSDQTYSAERSVTWGDRPDQDQKFETKNVPSIVISQSEASVTYHWQTVRCVKWVRRSGRGCSIQLYRGRQWRHQDLLRGGHCIMLWRP